MVWASGTLDMSGVVASGGVVYSSTARACMCVGGSALTEEVRLLPGAVLGFCQHVATP